MMSRFFLLPSILTIFVGCKEIYSQDNYLKIWYTRPAAIREEVLPIGNGRLGAMVYGRVGVETIQFNEETLWAGEPGNNITSSIKEDLLQIRQLIYDGNYKEANLIANYHLPFSSENNNNGMCYQLFGSLQITSHQDTGSTEYYRELDISNAVTSVKYKSNGVIYQR